MKIIAAIVVTAGLLIAACSNEQTIGGVPLTTICSTWMQEFTKAIPRPYSSFSEDHDDSVRRTAARLSLTRDQVELANDDCRRLEKEGKLSNHDAFFKFDK